MDIASLSMYSMVYFIIKQNSGELYVFENVILQISVSHLFTLYASVHIVDYIKHTYSWVR